MKPKIALFVKHPECSIQCANGMLTALSDFYSFKLFSNGPLEDHFFDDVDLICFPGGIGDADRYYKLVKQNNTVIRRYINRGGRYLGICMGAYWAGKHYLNILDGVDAVQYIKRPKTDTHRPHAKALDIKWRETSEKMFFYDGCSLVGDHRKFETIATYANGDSMAIFQNRIGLIGCHPESEKFWYDMYSWMGPHWHNGTHHKLLLEFTDQLMHR